MAQPLLVEKIKKKKSGKKKKEQSRKNWKGGWMQPANPFSQILKWSGCLSRASLSLSSSRKELHTLHWFPSSSCTVHCLCDLPFPPESSQPTPRSKACACWPQSLEQPHVPRCPGCHFIHTFAPVFSVGTSLSETAVSQRISFFPLPSPFLTFTFSWNFLFLHLLSALLM